MLTISIVGKKTADTLNSVKNALSSNKDDSIKILIDGPSQAETLKKFLEAQGFDDVVPEDDDGDLYIIASKSHVKVTEEPLPEESEPVPVQQEQTVHETKSTIGILISCRKSSRDYNSPFIRKFLLSLLKTESKPDVIGLIDSAVKISAYNSPLCVILKKLETEGVNVLVSDSCAQRLGMTEATGAGVIADMSEILDDIFSCSKIISI
ncbi:MAG: hypothetical protein IJR27_04370 [Synergistaceae bacterium]|nr:hypothetical protein [Synergistaceae bacterium]